VDKDQGRLETRRCSVFDQLQCLDQPLQWKELRCFAVLESERMIGDKTTRERRLYISTLAPDAQRIAHAVRAHWSVENRLHWTMDVSFNDDQMRAAPRPPPTTWPCSNTSPSISSGSTQSNAKEGSKQENSSQPLQTSTALKSSDSYELHAIALRRWRSANRPPQSVAFSRALGLTIR